MPIIDECEKYYEKYGREMIETCFPLYKNEIAVGLCGRGSDCFMFDDEVSGDHDSGVGFCLFLSDELYDEIGFDLGRKYSSLPKEFNGLKKGDDTPYGAGHFGVKKISDFFLENIGLPSAPVTLRDWLYMPEYGAAAAVNGRIFYDGEGEMSGIRQELLYGMPKDVKMKKMSLRLIECAQSGQYNFMRCIRHGEYAAAALALGEFTKSALSFIYLINNSYMPFYKWAFRGAGKFCDLSSATDDLKELITEGTNENTAKQKYELIEKICKAFSVYLKENGFTATDACFLEEQAYEIQSKIKSPYLRELHIMEG